MTTVSEKNRERILEAIDQLRRRKARPDIQRICNYLFRKFSINSAEAKADLQWCVDNSIVRKVEYKGSISYRNATKKIMPAKQQALHHQQRNIAAHRDSLTEIKVNKGRFAQLLTNALSELIVNEPDYLELGVPATLLIDTILAKDSVRYTKKIINILLEKEVEIGGVIRMENGSYMMGPSGGVSGADSDSDNNKDKTIEWLQQHHHNQLYPDKDVVVLSDFVEQRTNHLDDNKDGMIIHLKPRKRPGPKPGFKRVNLNVGGDNKSPDALMDSSADEKKSDNGLLRVGGRRKRAKKVFDPSDVHIPKKRGRPAGSLNKATIEKQMAKLNDDYRPESRGASSGRNSEQGGARTSWTCSVCSKKGNETSMVACRECTNRAHFDCLNNGDNMLLKMYPDNTWQCPNCKSCTICLETSEMGNLIVCSVCADGYHPTCHEPRITERIKMTQQWVCTNCQMPDDLKNEMLTYSEKNNSNDNNSSVGSNSAHSSSSNSPPTSPTPPQLSPQPNCLDVGSDSQSNKDSDDNKDYDDNIDPSIPDASNWSPDDVYQYFSQYFPKEAKIFKEQEIDGRSLLLLRRIDVLKNLKLKLGPALKIYRHVVKLQVRRDDPKLYWL